MENPPLSARGHKQALLLRQKIESAAFPRPQRLLVSPKLRTHQTFQAVGELCRVDLQLTPELDERQNSESGPQFQQRVRRFLAVLEKQGAGTLYVCTHLDWIEEALIAIASPEDLLSEKYQAWAPLQFIEFDLHDGLWHVQKSGRIE